MSSFQRSPNSAFKPMQTKQLPFTKNIISRETPFIENSSFIFQKQIDLVPQTNNIITTKKEISYLPIATNSNYTNTMNIQFESFISGNNNNNKISNLNSPSLGFGNTFYQFQTSQNTANSEMNDCFSQKTYKKKKLTIKTINSLCLPIKEDISLNENKKYTNVINNFYIQLPETKPIKAVYSYKTKNIKKNKCLIKDFKSINIKRNRNKLNCPLPQKRKIKKIDKTTMIIQFNQIKIENISLKTYPLISLPNNELCVEIYARLLTEEKYFKCEEINTCNLIIPTKDLSNETFISYFTNKLNEKKDVFFLEENKDEQLPYNIIHNYYSKIKTTIITIQKNFIGKRKGILNKEQCNILYNLIKTLNIIADIIVSFQAFDIYEKKQLQNKYVDTTVNNVKSKPSSEYEKQIKKDKEIIEKNKQKNKTQDSYECPFCFKIFNKGQKLGGHMSRNHPRQSEKYKEKLAVRNKRSQKRKLLSVIKEKFFKKYNMDYTKLEKKEIQRFLKGNKNEYLQFKKHEHKKYNLHIQENRNSYLEDYLNQMEAQTEISDVNKIKMNSDNKDLLFKVK